MDTPKPPKEYHSGRIGYRHVLMVLLFFGAIFKQATRVGLSVAMVAMVKPLGSIQNYNQTTGDNQTILACPENLSPIQNSSLFSNNITLVNSGYFEWDSKTQGLLHGAFYYGYLFSQIPGGWLSHRFGSTRPITACSLLIGIVTVLSPFAAYGSMWLFFIARVIIGITTGVIFPSIVHLWSEWSPPAERGRLLSGAGSGAQLGTVLGMFLSGLLASTFGWESIFFCFGALQLLWVIPWVILARDSPAAHFKISDEERHYIVSSIGKSRSGEKGHRHPIPWLAIFKTVPFYAILVVEFGHNWGFYTMLTNLPTYLSNIQHYSLKKNGFLSALPYLVRWAAIVMVVYAADWLRSKHFMSVSALRKTFTTVSFIITAGALIGLGYAGCNSALAVSLLVLTVGIWSLNSAGYFLGYVEMSPEFSGVLVSMGNTFGTTTGIIAPYVAGVLTNGPGGQTIENWRIVFLISAALYLLAAITYALFGSAEQQPWDPTGKNEKVTVKIPDESDEEVMFLKPTK
ncbi:sialin-like [Paramacrobiotus metropolitanus]|uniref:sialin-like n=1 Tax=Paramacrobiotus metropolitanus TaxID=2943436 RepID=UPI0024460F6A|nr:sialin-like [Paramacrobiotus metropolitanus]